MVVHIPTIGVRHVDLGCRVGYAKGSSFHTLRNEPVRELFLELQERSLVVARKADSDINLRSGIRADVDGVSLIGA